MCSVPPPVGKTGCSTWEAPGPTILATSFPPSIISSKTNSTLSTMTRVNVLHIYCLHLKVISFPSSNQLVAIFELMKVPVHHYH